jgi:hypothetical protein
LLAAFLTLAMLPLLQALTLGDKAGIPRETFLSFVDTFYPAKPIQVIVRAQPWATTVAGAATATVVLSSSQHYWQMVVWQHRDPGSAVSAGLLRHLGACWDLKEHDDGALCVMQ